VLALSQGPQVSHIVVVLGLVSVVDDDAGPQIELACDLYEVRTIRLLLAQVLFQDQAMLQDVALAGIWMVRAVHHDVSRRVPNPAALPASASWTGVADEPGSPDAVTSQVLRDATARF